MKVALAYIPNERREILMARRPLSKSFGGMWEFPGGKIELGESPEDCIVREIKEELCITVSVVSSVPPYKYKIDEATEIEFFPTFCAWDSGSIRVIEHEDVQFLRISAIHCLDLAPPDFEALTILQKAGFDKFDY